jgi:hypothetical protein
MTLRQYLDRKAEQWLPIIILVAVPSLAIWLFAPWPYRSAGFGLFVGVALWLFGLRPSHIRRPRCQQKIGELGSEYLAAKGSARGFIVHRERIEQLGGCPNCGLRLDEEIGTKG